MHYHYIQNNAPTLVLIHGFLGNDKDFDPIIHSLGTSFSYLLIDLPGHGKSTDRKTLTLNSFEALADEILGLFDHLKLKKPIGLGYSLGGRVLLSVACRYPRLFSQLILVSASAGLATEEEKFTRRVLDSDWIKKLSVLSQTAFLREWYKQAIFEPLTTQLGLDHLIQKRGDYSVEGCIHSLTYFGLGNMPYLLPKLGTLDLPIHVIVGEKDPKFCKIAQTLVSESKMAQLFRIPESGHAPHLEQPDTFVAILKNVLK